MNWSPKIGQPRFLTVDDILTIHAAAIDDYGGSRTLLDSGKLESAVAMACQGFGGQFMHAFPFEMAAAYCFHLAMNHPFEDGNKRVAWLSAVVFLRLNGWTIEVPDETAAELVLEMITTHRHKAWLAAQLEGATVQRSSLEFRDFFSSLTIADLAEHYQAFVAGTRQEHLASVQETAEALPIVGELFTTLREAEKAGDTEHAMILKAQIGLLIGLFRIAENAGYEW